jgi:hypothetical protein
VQITKTADKVAAVVGQTVKYTFTITNLTDGDPSTVAIDGAAPVLILSTILDDVLGDLSAQATIAGLNELDLGESGSFDVNYVVQAADPSPLMNTVSVLYNPEDFPNQITDDDSHTLYVVDAAITLTPATATNGIGETHTFTATVTVIGGVIATGDSPVTATKVSGPGTLAGVPGNTNGAGTGTGTHQFTLVSNTAGMAVFMKKVRDGSVGKRQVISDGAFHCCGTLLPRLRLTAASHPAGSKGQRRHPLVVEAVRRSGLNHQTISSRLDSAAAKG